MGNSSIIVIGKTDLVNKRGLETSSWIQTPDNLFYSVLSDITGLRIDGEHMLMGMMKELAGSRENTRGEYAP